MPDVIFLKRAGKFAFREKNNYQKYFIKIRWCRFYMKFWGMLKAGKLWWSKFENNPVKLLHRKWFSAFFICVDPSEDIRFTFSSVRFTPKQEGLLGKDRQSNIKVLALPIVWQVFNILQHLGVSSKSCRENVVWNNSLVVSYAIYPEHHIKHPSKLRFTIKNNTKFISKRDLKIQWGLNSRIRRVIDSYVRIGSIGLK